MPLDSGHTFSHYRLLEKIGEGGMGVVWKAEDLRLRRHVALKVLPHELVADPERRRRLVHEARAAAAVNHPNVAHVYEVDEAEGLVFLAMELVEGKSLRASLDGRPTPLREALRLATEVAEGLAAAHGARIIHRDLKPENVMVRPDGHIKILDFGLAKVIEEQEELTRSKLSKAATLTDELTGQGRVLGTAAYMSPEQARGERLDTRTDIFSFGSLLYEIVAGKAPFEGRSPTDILSSILRDLPMAPSTHSSEVPQELDRIVGKCLEKNPADRYQHADELALDLRKLQRSVQTGAPEVATPSGGVVTPRREEAPASRHRRPVAVAVGWAVLAVVLATLVVWQVMFRPATETGARTLLILPMEVRGQEEGAAYVGRAFAEALAVNLVQIETIQVLPVPDAGELGVGGTMARSRAAMEMGAGWLLTGALTREADTIRVSLNLVDPSANRILWGTDRTAKGDELMHLASDFAWDVAAQLGAARPKLYDHFENVTRDPKLAASPLYLEALAAARRVDPEAALEATEQLLETFPDQPDVHVLRTWAVGRLAWRKVAGSQRSPTSPEIKRFEAALADLARVDPTNPWAEVFRAHLLVHGWPEQRAVFTEVLDRDDLTPALRARVLRYRGQYDISVGDIEAGLRDLEETLRLTPASGDALGAYALFLGNFGRAREALVQLRQALAMEPTDVTIQEGLALTLERLDQWSDAAEWWSRLCDSSKRQRFCAQEARTLLKAERPDEARKAAEVAERMEDNWQGTLALAQYYSRAGEPTQAIRLLRRSEELNPSPTLLRGNGDFSSLRGDPEFERLASELLKEVVVYYAEECTSQRTQTGCALHAVALQLIGREAEAERSAVMAASLDGTQRGYLRLSWYHALVRDRDEVIRYLRRYLELRGRPNLDLQLARRRDFAWLVGDPEFDAVVAEIARPGETQTKASPR